MSLSTINTARSNRHGVTFWLAPDMRGTRIIAIVRRALGTVAICVLAIACPVTPVLAQSPASLQTPLRVPANPATVASAVNPFPEEAPPEYRVGPGDVIGITVYNMSELNRTSVVGSNGAVLLSYIPDLLYVNEETAQQIGEQIVAELKHLQILLDPQISVAIVKVESKPVVVGGDVRNPQVLQEIRPFTLLGALMQAGGPQSDAGADVLLSRVNSKGELLSFDFQLSRVMSGSDAVSNTTIVAGDTIQVLPGQKVYVAGAVKTPGAFDLRGDQGLSVAKLMAITGGWNPDSNPSKAVIVRESRNGQRQTVPVDLRKIMARKEPDVTLEANDMLYVPGSKEKRVGLTAIEGVGAAAMYGLGYMVIRP